MANTKVALRRRQRSATNRLFQPGSGGGGPAGTVLQTGYQGAVDGAQTVPTSVTLANPTTAGGSLLVGVAGFWGSNNFATGNVTDNKGNTFAFDFEVATGASEAAVGFYSCSNFLSPGLTRTLIGSASCAQDSSIDSLSTTLDCGTVTAGDLLVFAVGGTTRFANVDWTLAKDSGSATIGTVSSGQRSTAASATALAGVEILYCQVTGSGTLVMRASLSGTEITYGYELIGFKYTGHDTTTPVVAGVSQLAGTGAHPVGGWSPSTATLANTPKSNDEVLILVNADVDPGSGKGWSSIYTELYDTTDVNHFVSAEVSVRTGSTSTTITWPTEDDTPNTYSYAGAAIIVKAAPHIVTVTNTAVVGKAIGVVEYSSTVTFDKSASDVDDTSSPHTSGTTTTLTSQPGIALAAIAIDTGSNAALTPDGDWTQIGEQQDGTSLLVNNMVYKTLSSTAAEDAGWTWAGAYAGNGSQAGIVTYRDPGGGGAAAGLTPRGRKHRIVPISSKKSMS